MEGVDEREDDGGMRRRIAMRVGRWLGGWKEEEKMGGRKGSGVRE